MDDRVLRLVVCLLFVCCGCLLYVEWWRTGEIEMLNSRVSGLENAEIRRRRRRTAKKEESEPK